MSVSLTPDQIRKQPRIALIGQGVVVDRYVDFVNADHGDAEVWTIAASTPTDATYYELTLYDDRGSAIAVVGVTSSGTSESDLEAALASAWNANPIARMYGVAAAGSDLVITGTKAGRAFVVAVTEGASDLTATNTADASAGAGLPFGVAVAHYGAANGGDRHGGLNAVCRLPSILQARSYTVEVTYQATVVYTVTVQWRGVDYTVSVTADTDGATTAGAIVAALNAALPADSVLAEDNTDGTFGLTSEIVGEPFRTQVSAGATATTGGIEVTDAEDGPLTDVNAMLAGIILRRADVQADVLGSSETTYPPGRETPVLQQGVIGVADPGGSIAYRAPVYVGTGASNAGQVFAAAGADRALIDPAKAWFTGQSAGGVALVKLNTYA